MPEFLRPGVFIEEIERGPRPIEGVPTSTAAFLGETERGPLRPTLVTSYNDYRRTFGDPFLEDRYMPQAVNGFFENGGKRLFVCRIVASKAGTAQLAFGSLNVKAVGPGAWGSRIWAKTEAGKTTGADGKSVGFRLSLAYFGPGAKVYDPFDPLNDKEPIRPTVVEIYDDLSSDPLSADYFAKRLLDGTTNRPVSALAVLEAGTTFKPGDVPTFQSDQLDNGTDVVGALKDVEYIGMPNTDRPEAQGLTQLELDPFREVSLVYAPRPPGELLDVKAIFLALIGHCERRKFCFAVVDPPRGSAAASLDPRSSITDTSYAALYYPWIVASDPRSGERRLVPPGGHVLGVYARSDTERGVFKAPANEVLRGAIDLEFDVDDGRHDVLNPRGVNAIRSFPGRGIRVFGARTLSSNALWKYVSVRRLFIFIERSIFEGTQFVVFEPNDERLWARVKDSVRLFLRGQFRAGALFGAREEEAFFITCDRTTMTQDDILNGRLICEIGIAPVRPAEFVIFRIFQNTAEAQR